MSPATGHLHCDNSASAFNDAGREMCELVSQLLQTSEGWQLHLYTAPAAAPIITIPVWPAGPVAPVGPVAPPSCCRYGACGDSAGQANRHDEQLAAASVASPCRDAGWSVRELESACEPGGRFGLYSRAQPGDQSRDIHPSRLTATTVVCLQLGMGCRHASRRYKRARLQWVEAAITVRDIAPRCPTLAHHRLHGQQHIHTI